MFNPCLSVFDQFVGLALKGLKFVQKSKHSQQNGFIDVVPVSSLVTADMFLTTTSALV